MQQHQENRTPDLLRMKQRYYPLRSDPLVGGGIASVQDPELLRRRLHCNFKDPLLFGFNELAKNEHNFYTN